MRSSSRGWRVRAAEPGRGRVLAARWSARRRPGFDRATMDGYALTADSTEGASSYNRSR